MGHLLSGGEKSFSTEEEWESYLDDTGCTATQQRRLDNSVSMH